MSDTVFACLTPAGTGAIATLAVRGPAAWTVCRGLFTPVGGEVPQDVAVVSPQRFYLGQFGDELRDQVVLALRRTSPPWVELHCHGGRLIVDVLRDTLRRHGLTELSWDAWLRATDERAEAAVQLAHALTRRTAEILLDQYHGAFDRAVAELRLLDATSAERRIERLLRYRDLGRHLTTPWRVTVAGAPNVGKSSLVNALAGYQRCIVSATPGTTRDVVTTRLAIEGWPVELCDTAGLRAAGEALEEAGMQLARRTAAEADLCLWVLDGSTTPVWPEEVGTPVLRVVNKVDLPAAWPVEAGVRVSARTGEGLAELSAAIARQLVPHEPEPGEAVPVSAEQVALLQMLAR